ARPSTSTGRSRTAAAASNPSPTAAINATGATYCCASRNTANPPQTPTSHFSTARPASGTPAAPITNPTTPATTSPSRYASRRPSHPNPAIPSTASNTRAVAPTTPSYPAGTAFAFQIPPSDSRLPTAPNGVSARDANASTPTGSPSSPAGLSAAATSQ